MAMSRAVGVLITLSPEKFPSSPEKDSGGAEDLECIFRLMIMMTTVSKQ